MEQQDWTALCRLAEGQCGLFSAAQAAHLGASPAQLSRAVRRGNLRRSRSGVYAISGTPASRWESLVAAALAVGPDAVISHNGAAVLHRMYGAVARPCAPELIVPRDRHPSLSGAFIHRIGPLPAPDVIVKYGVYLTSPARTLVDLAARYKVEKLERMLDEALIARRLSVAELGRCVERTSPKAPGQTMIRHVLAQRSEGPLADSVLEGRALAALRPLSPFKVHFVVGVGKFVYVIDAAWPHKRVGAEIVGRAHRVASRSAFDQERCKLNALASAGWRIAHLTSAMSAGEMLESVRRLL
jgi:Transcriptional regulator, AbiEi antitoxin